MKAFKTAAIALLALIGTATVAAGTAIATAEVPTTDFALEETYFLGETLSAENATLTVGGEKLPASTVLYAPDGRAYSAGSYVLDKLGRYTLELRSEKGGTHKLRRSFVVGESVASFSQNGGSYVLSDRGLVVSLNDGNKLTVNRTVDISGATVDDQIVTISVDPETTGVADFTKITVTLTDIENEDCYLRVLLQSSADNHAASYGLAGGTNQALTGYEAEWDRIHKNNQYGAFMPFTFYGEGGGSNELGIRYDSETKEIYALRGFRIIDLDDPTYFPNRWQGFESGKVRVSVECSSLVNDFAHITVKSLMGKRLSGDFAADETAPALRAEWSGKTPYAVVGKSFPLLPYTAMDDLSGEVPVSCEVWYRYGYSNSYLVGSADGAFTPDKEGTYTAVYSAKDAFGNTAVLPVEIEARTKEEPITLTLEEGYVTSGELGMKVPLPVCRAEGGSGEAAIRIEAVLGDEILQLTDGFLPEKAGNWTIRFVATDYVGSSKTVSYSFEAKAGKDPLFAEEPQLPRYLIAGKNYAFSALKTIDYTSGTRVDGMSDIYLTVGGLRRKLVSGTPVLIESARSAELEYSSGGAVLQRSIPIITVEKDGELDMSRYFDTSAISSVDTEGVHFEGDRPETVTFIRELLAEGLTARFDVGDYGANEISLILTDYFDPERVLTLRIAAQEDGYALYANGAAICTGTDRGFTSRSLSNEFDLLYENGNISVDGVTTYRLSDRTDFEGFPSNRVYLEFRFGRADGGTLVVKNLNRQPTNSVKSDRIRPRIVVLGDYGGEKLLGDEVHLMGADALDVLDPELTFTVTVTDPEGQAVNDASGRALTSVDGRGEYFFKTEKYGNYRVVYTASDSKQSGSFTYIIPVEDKTLPTVTLSGEMKSEYASGERIPLPTASASDNCEGELTVCRYLMTPFGNNILLNESTEAIVLTECGKYSYCIVVYDAAGNMQLTKIDFLVKEVNE